MYERKHSPATKKQKQKNIKLNIKSDTSPTVTGVVDISCNATFIQQRRHYGSSTDVYTSPRFIKLATFFYQSKSWCCCQSSVIRTTLSLPIFPFKTLFRFFKQSFDGFIQLPFHFSVCLTCCLMVRSIASGKSEFQTRKISLHFRSVDLCSI